MSNKLNCLTDFDGKELKNGYMSGAYYGLIRNKGYFFANEEVCFWNGLFGAYTNFILNENRYCAYYEFRCQLNSTDGFSSIEDFRKEYKTKAFDKNHNPIYDCFTGGPLTEDLSPVVEIPEHCTFKAPPRGDTTIELCPLSDYSEFYLGSNLEKYQENTPLQNIYKGFSMDLTKPKAVDLYDVTKDFNLSKLKTTWPEYLVKLEEEARAVILDTGLMFDDFKTPGKN